MSPTARTLAKLRAEGWNAWIVEKWNPHAHVRVDLGGFGDVLAWAPGRGILAVQATSGSNVSARLAKIAALDAAKSWVLSPARLEVWGWRKVGKRGERKLWECRVVPIERAG